MKQFFISLGISLLAVFAPIVPLIGTTMALILTDFLFGVYRAYKTDPKSVSSRKMGHTISKVLLYNVCIICVYLIEHYVVGGALPLAKIVTGIICLTELKSIDESFQTAFGFSFYTKLVEILRRGTSETKDIVNDQETTTQQ